MKSPNLRFKLATYPFLSLYFRERMRKNSLHMSLQRETFFEYLNIFFLWSVYAEQKFSKCKLYSHVCHRLAGSFWTKELFLLMLQLCFHGSDLTMDWWWNSLSCTLWPWMHTHFFPLVLTCDNLDQSQPGERLGLKPNQFLHPSFTLAAQAVVLAQRKYQKCVAGSRGRQPAHQLTMHD